MPSFSATRLVCSLRGFRWRSAERGDGQRELAGPILDRMPQTAEVAAEDFVAPKGEGKNLKQVLEGFVPGGRKSVEDAKPFASVDDEAGVFQVGQVTRDVGLRSSQHRLDVAPTEFAPGEKVNDAEARSVSEAFEMSFQLADSRAHVYAHRRIQFTRRRQGLQGLRGGSGARCPRGNDR
jgi:hypothetical protein